MAKLLLIYGAALIVLALCWPILRHYGMSPLPGDITYRSGAMTFYFPFATSAIVGIGVSILFWFFRR